MCTQIGASVLIDDNWNYVNEVRSERAHYV